MSDVLHRQAQPRRCTSTRKKFRKRRTELHYQRLAICVRCTFRNCVCSRTYRRWSSLIETRVSRLIYRFSRADYGPSNSNLILDTEAPVKCVRVCEQGLSVIAGTLNGFLQVWDLSSNLCVRSWRAHTHRLSCLDHRRGWLVTGGSDNLIKVWELSSGEEIDRLAGHSDCVSDVSISQDGKLLVSSSEDQSVCLWSLMSGLIVRRWKMKRSDWARTVRFVDDHIVCGSESSIRVFHPRKDRCVLKLHGHTSEVLGMDHNEYILVTSSDNERFFWRLSDLKQVWTMYGTGSAVCFHPWNQRLLAVAAYRKIMLFDLIEQRCVCILEAHSWMVGAMYFTPDGSRLISVCSVDKYIHVWVLNQDVLAIGTNL